MSDEKTECLLENPADFTKIAEKKKKKSRTSNQAKGNLLSVEEQPREDTDPSFTTTQKMSNFKYTFWQKDDGLTETKHPLLFLKVNILSRATEGKETG